MNFKKAVFFDRDGVLNYDRENYVYEPDHFILYPHVSETLKTLRRKGYLLFVITNQAGISRGIYTRDQMRACHKKLQNETQNAFEHIYYAPWHPNQSKSLSRKPGSLLFQKALAQYRVDPLKSWMIGDRNRDLIPAKSLGLKTIGIRRNEQFEYADYVVDEIEKVLTLIK